ncbi:PREDICTED: DNA (cytosine-5)-methyltransferase DRM2-like [Fragaria vesca subsp. vesca]
MPNNSNDRGYEHAIAPKEEILEFDLPSDHAFPTHFGNNDASSSGSNMRANMIGMGFSPSLVDKVIGEKGEEDAELLLETLLSYQDAQKSDSGLSDSLDSLFGDKDSSSVPEVSSIIQPKEEPDLPDGLEDEKKASLLMMNFSRDEVEFALNRLGEDATINDLVDFIIASQISVKLENDVDTVHGDEEKERRVIEKKKSLIFHFCCVLYNCTVIEPFDSQDTSDENLYGIMEKSIRLLEMGFSENQVSVAIEKFGSGAPLTDLAESIVTGKIYDDCYEEKIKCSTSHSDHSRNVSRFLGTASYGSVKVENEDFYPDTASGSRDRDLAENYLGKRPKQEIIDDSNSVPQFRVSRPIDFGENRKGKRPKREYVDHSISSAWMEEKVDPEICKVGNLKVKSGNKMVGKAPYFLYGNVLNLPYDSWSKVSQFLYDHQPEYVNSQFFSALNRKEGYVHNLPTENRFRIPEEPPMTIQDVIPYAKNLWPPWDTRKQLTCISSETSGISQLCDRLGRMVSDCGGMLSPEKQREILHHCNLLNLVWVGRNKLGPLQPEYLEQILGYPLNHTKVGESGLIERLISLKYSFQTDTLAYHLSVLKHLYPAGITMFSIFSGIGGAEIALHKLGIHLKGVVSVETCATKRKILRRWWETTGQIGQLEQIDDIQKLSSSKLESLMKRFGSFDFLICQNPCSSSVSKVPAQSGADPGFDFSLFYEFVRVYQRVKNMMDRKS